MSSSCICQTPVHAFYFLNISLLHYFPFSPILLTAWQGSYNCLLSGHSLFHHHPFKIYFPSVLIFQKSRSNFPVPWVISPGAPYRLQNKIHTPKDAIQCLPCSDSTYFFLFTSYGYLYPLSCSGLLIHLPRILGVLASPCSFTPLWKSHVLSLFFLLFLILPWAISITISIGKEHSSCGGKAL